MQTHLRTEIVLGALHMAIWQRRPEAVIHYSDEEASVPRGSGACLDLISLWRSGLTWAAPWNAGLLSPHPTSSCYLIHPHRTIITDHKDLPFLIDTRCDWYPAHPATSVREGGMEEFIA